MFKWEEHHSMSISKIALKSWLCEPAVVSLHITICTKIHSEIKGLILLRNIATE